jgi:predicted TPR repeat methyltransferase
MSDAQKTLQRAVAEHQAGRVGEAEKLYKRVLNHDPNNVEALRLWGLLASQVGRHDVALQLISRALSIKPTWAEAWGDLATAYAGLGKIPEAIGSFQKALGLRPKFAGAKSNLADLLKKLGRVDDAMKLWGEAIRDDPTLPEPYYNIGGTLFAQGKHAEAEEYFKKAIEKQPGYAPAYNNVGAVQWSQGRRQEARANFTKALELNPQYAQAWNNMGSVWDEQGQIDKAMECWRKAIALRPDLPDAYNNLGLALEKKGDHAGAAAHWHEALRLRPGWEEPQYYLAAAKQAAAPTTAPPAYVAKLFDDYADRFDDHLMRTLEYRVPQLLLEAVGRAGLNRAERVIDLGCGTGLGGEKFRPLAGQMVGVDLSARMIERARGRNIYDQLIVGELVEVLAAQPRNFDLVLASDVYSYFGDLKTVLSAAAGAMRQGGLMAFSVEKLAAGEGGDFLLRQSRRFAHSREYIDRISREVGLELVEVSDSVLRLDQKQPVEGMIVIARKT